MDEEYLRTMISFLQKAGEIVGLQMTNEEGTWKEQELKRLEQMVSDHKIDEQSQKK